MAEFRLPRLPRSEAIVDGAGKPLLALQRWWQSVMSKIETQEATQDTILADLAAVQAEQAAMLEDIAAALNLGNTVTPDIAPLTVNADHTGVVLSGQLPRNVAATRYDGVTDVTTSATWSATTLSGGITYTIGAATGIVNITALESSSVVQITSVYEDISRSRILVVNRVLADPPPSSGGGSESVYDSSITATNSASYGSANAGVLTLACGASGEIDLAAPLEFLSDGSAGSYHAYGKWQYRLSGDVTWIDAGAEVQSGLAAEVDSSGTSTSGAISINQTITGLTASSNYELQLLLRNASGTHTLSYSGTASATTE
jgi:hypothetical protein